MLKYLIRVSIFIILAVALSVSPILADDIYPVVKVGIITDVHVGNAGSETRLSDFVNIMNKWQPAFVIQLGDAATGLSDNAIGGYTTIAELDRFRTIYDKLNIPHYWVAGNHDVDVISVDEWKSHAGINSDQYVLNYGGMRFIIINTEITAEWVVGFLEPQLSSENYTNIIFGHKPLVSGNFTTDYLMVGADNITQLLTSSNNTKMYICGHVHQNDYLLRNGVEYMTLYGSLSYSGNQINGFSAMTFYSDGSYYLKGYGGQIDRGEKSATDNQVFPEYIPSIPPSAPAPPEPPIYYPPGGYPSSGGSGGGSISVTPIGEKRTTSLLGVSGRDGTIWEDVEVLSADSKLSLFIPKRTIAHNKQGGLLPTIRVVDIGSQNGTVSHVYELQPSGAMFSQPLELRIRYKPVEDVSDTSLFIALKAGNDWQVLESKVDVKERVVIAHIGYLSTFAVLSEETAFEIKEDKPEITEVKDTAFDYRLTWAWFWYCMWGK
jgi:Icc-related predicted phosphoesterase